LLGDEGEVTPEILEHLLSRKRTRASVRPQPVALAPRAEAILRLLKGGWTSAAEIASAVDTSTRTVNRELWHLVQRGLVESAGEARARRYRVSPPTGARRDSSRWHRA
jgi:DNA-binding NarL/FixJ family response regulator